MQLPEAAPTTAMADSSAVPVAAPESRARLRAPAVFLAAILCSLLTIPVAWNARDWISADGISYLEVALNSIRLGPQYLFTNGYWSPGYPALLAIALKITHASMARELAVIHSVDWLICVTMYAAFAWLIFNILKWIRLTHGDAVSGGAAGYGAILFFSFTLLFVANLDQSLWYVGPNVMLELAVYLAAAMCVRLSFSDTGPRQYLLFGLILAFGYSVKAVLFPLSLVLLAILFLWPVEAGRGRKGVAIAAGVFLLASSPLIAVLSISKGRVTFGDTGRLNYAWYVNTIPRALLWQEHKPGGPIFLHPPIRVSTNPPIVKFEGPGPVESVHPYWYDPSWWYDGLQSHVDLRQQINQILRAFGLKSKVMIEGYSVFQLAEQWLPIWAGLFAFLFLGLRLRTAYDAMKTHVWLLLWPAAALFSFACVLLLYRYVVSFIVLGALALFVAAWVVVKPERWIGITLTVAATLILSYVPGYAREVAQNRRLSATAGNRVVADKLRAMGIRPGDELASVDFAEGAYYARLVGARFTQEIRVKDPEVLSKIPAEEAQQVIATLRANGAKALFSTWRPAFANDSGWVLLAEHLYVRML